jgi:hypothetical protein
MPEVKFTDIKVGQVYVSHGGTAIIDEKGTIAGWGYDRIKVIAKNKTSLTIETPWGTSCTLKSTYLLSLTAEVIPRNEFNLIITYISKQEIPFDDAVARHICTDDIVQESFTDQDEFLAVLIKYFDVPRSLSSAAQKFGENYRKIRYLIDKIENIDRYKVKRKCAAEGKILVHIIEVNNGKRT